MTLPPLLRVLLWPLSLLYGQSTRLRAWFYSSHFIEQKHLAKPVISVGNLTVGGTGKTPMVIWLAERLLAEGHRVAILSRGYKGDGATSDEIELMKFRLQERACFGVGADRYRQGKNLESSTDVFVLDDGFQHLALARDVDILLMDSSQPLARQTLLPTGRLREPISAMARADILVFTRAETVHGTSSAVDKFHDVAVFSASTRLLGFRRLGHDIELLSSDQIGSGPFYAFCGIGNPRAFLQDLQNWHLPVVDDCHFPDHHRYDSRDARELQESARRVGARALLTTEKDARNLRQVQFATPVYVAIIDLDIPKADAFLSLIRDKLQSRVAVA